MKRRLVMAAIASALSFVTASSFADTLSFEFTKESDAGQWRGIKLDWEVIKNRFAPGQSDRNQWRMAFLRDVRGDDIELQLKIARLKLPGSGGGDYALGGIILRAKPDFEEGTVSGYLGLVGISNQEWGGDGFAVIFEMKDFSDMAVGLPQKQLCYARFKPNLGKLKRTYEIAFSADDDRLKLSVDEDVACRARDRTYGSGAAGLFAYPIPYDLSVLKAELSGEFTVRRARRSD